MASAEGHAASGMQSSKVFAPCKVRAELTRSQPRFCTLAASLLYALSARGAMSSARGGATHCR
ncbi:MAG: hypothetical protein M3458_06535 [Acidobacteriota bacterium]|nr:hypothetical protein [Acidobacteriota bacterium]